jgi:hypothetical protein
MIFRSVKPVGVAQMRFVQVPLVEWCLGRVVDSKLRVVNGIDNSHDLKELDNSGNHNKKMRVATGTESSDSQNLWSGSRTDNEKYRTV